MSILKVKDKDGKFVDIPVISGRPASIKVGEVKLLEPNSEPTIENVGTEYDAIFNFGIPKGEYIVEGENFRLDLSDYAKQKQLDKEIQNRQQTDNNLQSQIKSLASGSPLVASSISEMTDTTKVYVNTTDGKWYYYNGSKWLSAGVYQSTGIEDGSVTPQKTTFIKEYNIINKDLIVNNKRPSTATNPKATINSIIDDDKSSYTNQIFNVKPGDIIRYNYQYVCCVFYDDSDLLVSAPVGEFKEVTVPTNATQMRVWTNTHKYNDLMVSINTELPDEYYGYKEYECNIKPKKETEINKLWGKSIYFDGDSVAYGYGNNGVSYADMISENNNMEMTKKAVSGTTIAKKQNQTKSIYERVHANSANNYDYVIIEGGLNDMFQNIELGEISDGYTGTFNDYTFTGALEHLCRVLVMNCASAKKGFILTNRKVNSYMDSQKVYWDRAKEVLKKWSISYIDLSEVSGCLPLSDALLNTYFFIPSGATVGDGTHPNELGYKTFFVDQITAWLKTL